MFQTLANTEQFSAHKLWYTETCTFHFVGPITRWRILPTAENYEKLAPPWRPTETQLTTFHWPAIDWLPFPGLRDNMIRHANEYDLTQFLEESMDRYCLEVRLDVGAEKNVPGIHTQEDVTTGLSTEVEETYVYYRLSEFLSYLSGKDDTEQESGPGKITLPPGLETKFLLALQGVETPFKLEPGLFEQFPFLFCDQAVVKGSYLPLNSPWHQLNESDETDEYR
ncbi:putative phosphoketolase [Fonsecaea nubica]|uniref:Putative phosphoketolase n=1 Tax=Fonsecaea nubica TaxID=856822 RepID=A0A178D2B4_9EURO|nr:putative phosphoketolase [Fonsecaea nubica]OAL35275.1 putative phosphoketolase [Fonsecaea nubica]